MHGAFHQNREGSTRVLNAYLLGRLDFDELLALQRRLVYEVAGNRSAGVLLICEHGPGITIGREGSLAHVRLEARELANRGWPVRWVNRGGGCLVSAPGQVVLYPILALDRFNLNVQSYLNLLHEWLLAALASFEVQAEARPPLAGVWAGQRRLAHVGIAVRDWVASFGCTVNVEPNLSWFRDVSCDGDDRPMTSLARERQAPVRPAAVRQRLLADFADRFGFERVSLFHQHPLLFGRPPVHAAVTRPC
jgi:lipoyl(octanoyl) transferase